MKNGSLRLRLLAGAGLFIALGVLATWYGLQQIFTGYVAAQYEREMSTAIDTLAAGVEFDGETPVIGRVPTDPRYELPAGGRYWEVVPETGDPIRSRSLWDTAIVPKDLAQSGYAAFMTTLGPDGEPMLVLARPLVFESAGGGRQIRFFAGFSATEMETALAGFRRELAFMLGLTAVMLMLASILQVLVGLRPLRALLADVAKIRSGDASRLRADVPTEVQPLVAEINYMLDEKAEALDRAGARAADLAHGLKTPLTAILQAAETLPPETGGPIIEHVGMIRQRADRHLQRARMGVGQDGGTDLAEIAGKVVKVISAIPSDRVVDWRVDIARDLKAPIDTADLAEVLGNILDNARKWAASHVLVSAARRGDRVVIDVTDDGPGIPPDERERILQRGVHAGDPESETGLGLAIASEIADAYGGMLTLGGAPQEGLRVTIALPAVVSGKVKSPA